MDRVRIILIGIILLLTGTSGWLAYVDAIPSNTNTIIEPGSMQTTATIFLYWDGISIFGKSGATGQNLFSTSDIGSAFNTAISDLPTVTNPITTRAVPIGTVFLKNKPGVYSGTTPIQIYDDYYVTLMGEAPSTLSVENPATGAVQAIDIESASGVLQMLHNPNNALGGGTIEVKNLDFKTSTTITTALNGNNAIVSLGGTTTNVARLLVQNSGCDDLSNTNTCWSFRSNSGDDRYDVEDIFTAGSTFHTMVFVQVNHFYGVGLSVSASAVSNANTQSDSIVLWVIPEGNFQWNNIHIFGSANAWLKVDYSGSNPHFFAYFTDFFTELTTTANTPGISGTYRAVFTNPVIFNRFQWGATYNPLNDTLIALGSGFLQVVGSVQYDNFGKITFPFAALTVSGNTIGPLLGRAAAPTASTDYIVEGTPIFLTSTGGTGVSITVKDPGGNTVTGLSGLATLTAQYLPVGYKVNFGAFSVAPTVTAFGANS